MTLFKLQSLRVVHRGILHGLRMLGASRAPAALLPDAPQDLEQLLAAVPPKAICSPPSRAADLALPLASPSDLIEPRCSGVDRLALRSTEQLQRHLERLKQLLGRQRLPRPTHLTVFGMPPMPFPVRAEHLEPQSEEFLECLRRFLGRSRDKNKALRDLIN